MRTITFALLLSACGSSEKKPEPEAKSEYAAEPEAEHAQPTTDPALDTTGLPAKCQLYIDKVVLCMNDLPPETKTAFHDALAQTVPAWREVAQTPDGLAALDAGCGSAVDAAKTAMEQLCPGVRWE